MPKPDWAHRVTVDFPIDLHEELMEHLRKIGKERLGKNEFICRAVQFALAAGVSEVTPIPRARPHR